MINIVLKVGLMIQAVFRKSCFPLCGWNEQVRLVAPFQEAVISLTLGTLYSRQCQAEHGTHTYRSISRRVVGIQLSLCAQRSVVESKQQQSSERRTAQGSVLLGPVSSFGGRDGSVSDVSCRSGPAQGRAAVPQDGVRPPPGRTISEALLSPPALHLSRESYELLTPLLTEPVQEARSAVSGDQQTVRKLGSWVREHPTWWRYGLLTEVHIKHSSGDRWLWEEGQCGNSRLSPRVLFISV